MTALQIPELPSLEHLHFTEFDKVYEPAEDSFLFVDALTSDAALLQSLMPGISLEIGSGSGVITSHLSAILAAGGKKALHLTTDINAYATKTTLRTAVANSVPALEV